MLDPLTPKCQRVTRGMPANVFDKDCSLHPAQPSRVEIEVHSVEFQRSQAAPPRGPSLETISSCQESKIYFASNGVAFQIH